MTKALGRIPGTFQVFVEHASAAAEDFNLLRLLSVRRGFPEIMNRITYLVDPNWKGAAFWDSANLKAFHGMVGEDASSGTAICRSLFLRMSPFSIARTLM